MATISIRTSIPANTVSLNVLAGSPFEFLGLKSIVRLANTHAGATPELITMNFQIGGESLANAANVSNRTAFPTLRDDIAVTAGGNEGERLFLTYTNASGAAILVDTLVEIMPL